MKVRTSISVNGDLLKRIDKLPNEPTRSQIIEEALIHYFKSLHARQRAASDRAILDSLHKELNLEASDVLKYQKR